MANIPIFSPSEQFWKYARKKYKSFQQRFSLANADEWDPLNTRETPFTDNHFIQQVHRSLRLPEPHLSWTMYLHELKSQYIRENLSRGMYAVASLAFDSKHTTIWSEKDKKYIRTRKYHEIANRNETAYAQLRYNANIFESLLVIQHGDIGDPEMYMKHLLQQEHTMDILDLASACYVWICTHEEKQKPINWENIFSPNDLFRLYAYPSLVEWLAQNNNDFKAWIQQPMNNRCSALMEEHTIYGFRPHREGHTFASLKINPRTTDYKTQVEHWIQCSKFEWLEIPAEEKDNNTLEAEWLAYLLFTGATISLKEPTPEGSYVLAQWYLEQFEKNGVERFDLHTRPDWPDHLKDKSYSMVLGSPVEKEQQLELFFFHTPSNFQLDYEAEIEKLNKKFTSLHQQEIDNGSYKKSHINMSLTRLQHILHIPYWRSKALKAIGTISNTKMNEKLDISDVYMNAALRNHIHKDNDSITTVKSTMAKIFANDPIYQQHKQEAEMLLDNFDQPPHWTTLELLFFGNHQKVEALHVDEELFNPQHA